MIQAVRKGCLEGYFISHSRAKVTWFKDEMSSSKKDVKTINDYVERVQSLSSQLTTRGCIVFKEDHIMTILNGHDGVWLNGS